MRLTRYFKASQVKLELEARRPDPIPEAWTEPRIVWAVKEAVIDEMIGLLEAGGEVRNSSKLREDLLNRERKASTGIGGGIAMPHVRTNQARAFTIAFARSTAGVDFDAIDGEKVHFVFAVIAPPYDDKLYLQVYKQIAEVFGRADVREELLAATDAHQVVRIVGRFDE